MITSFFTDSILIQTAVFVLSSTLFLLFTKPLVSKYLKTKNTPTNVNSILHKHGIVTREINGMEGEGQVTIGGEVWSAKPEDDNLLIKKGTEVEILKVDGVKVIVTPIKTLEEKI